VDPSDTSHSLEDWEHVHEVVAQAYFPHVMLPLTARTGAHSAVEYVDLGTCRIARIALGGEVAVTSDHPEAYGINIPISGEMTSIIEGTEVTSAVGKATVCPPNVRTVMPQWRPSCQLIGFKIDRDYLHREADRVLARRLRRLPLQIDLDTAHGQSWLKLLRSLYDQIDTDAGLLRNDLVLTQLSGAITTGFLLTAVPEEDTGRIGMRPRMVKRVMVAIDEDPARPWTPGDLAQIAGVSVRRLQQAFREYVNMTPFEYLQNVRLEGAHTDLVVSSPPTTVADIAVRWGIMHTGRFAAAYRKKYGVPPSHTLAQ
jgi:AraC-like DNA-binding protein